MSRLISAPDTGCGVGAAPRLAHCDAVMLARLSTSWARDVVSAVFPGPVLTSPGAAVDKLRREVR